MYTELLERAVAALKSGKQPELEAPLARDTEIDLGVPALIPADYLPDVHERLVMYKRVASARDEEALRDLQVEMIDRFGLLPDAAKNLFHVAELKLQALPLGIRRVEASATGGRILFDAEPKIDVGKLIQLVQQQPRAYKFDGRQTLRFNVPGATLAERSRSVEYLLELLAPTPAASPVGSAAPH
jgi:transcription-repair coupling factor (superfamily II helicase)